MDGRLRRLCGNSWPAGGNDQNDARGMAVESAPGRCWKTGGSSVHRVWPTTGRVRVCGGSNRAVSFLFFFNDTATTEIYTLSLHDALPPHPTSDRGPRPVAAPPTRPPWSRRACC